MGGNLKYTWTDFSKSSIWLMKSNFDLVLKARLQRCTIQHKPRVKWCTYFVFGLWPLFWSLECANIVYSEAFKGIGQVGFVHVDCPHEGIHNHQGQVIWSKYIHIPLNVTPILDNVGMNENPWPIVHFNNFITCNANEVSTNKYLGNGSLNLVIHKLRPQLTIITQLLHPWKVRDIKELIQGCSIFIFDHGSPL